MRVFAEQGRGGHDLAGLAIAALSDIQLAPRFLQRMGAIGGKSLDRGDPGGRRRGHRCKAGAGRDSVEMNGARAALANATTELCANQIEMIAKHPKKRGVVSHVHGVGLAVYVQVKFTHGGKNETVRPLRGRGAHKQNRPADVFGNEKLRLIQLLATEDYRGRKMRQRKSLRAASGQQANPECQVA